MFKCAIISLKTLVLFDHTFMEYMLFLFNIRVHDTNTVQLI